MFLILSSFFILSYGQMNVILQLNLSDLQYLLYHVYLRNLFFNAIYAVQVNQISIKIMNWNQLLLKLSTPKSCCSDYFIPSVHYYLGFYIIRAMVILPPFFMAYGSCGKNITILARQLLAYWISFNHRFHFTDYVCSKQKLT